MGFLPQTGDEVSEQEIVRVRAHLSWLRIDARFGSVYRRRDSAALILAATIGAQRDIGRLGTTTDEPRVVARYVAEAAEEALGRTGGQASR